MTSALAPFDGFDLQVLTPEDLPVLARWHANPQVYRWWEGVPLAQEQVRARYLDSPEPVTRCLVYGEGRPLGYLQFFRYEVADWRAAVGLGENEDAWGIDLFLADEADRGRGLGARLLAGTLARLAEERGATLVLIDPLLDNPRAINCYRKAGFTPRRVLPSHEEQAGVRKDALLMAWRPPGRVPLAEEAQEGQSGGLMTAGPPPAGTPTPRASTRLDLFRRVARWVILASIFVNALFGIWAVAGSLGELESHILFTSLLITACGAVAAAASAAIPEDRLGPLPVIGIAAAVAGFAVLIAALWQDFTPAPLWRSGATLIILALGIAYASLLSGAHLPGRFRRLVPAGYGLAVAAGAFLVAVAWGYSPGDSWRLFFIAAVLLGAITIAVPITARLRPAREAPPPVRHCPYCGRSITDAAERTTGCPSCGRRFRVVGR
jgi:aminoglycoside 6'-N-acetyltransferase